MEKSKQSNIIYSGSLLAKNTIYNLLGYSVPLIFAILIIPFLIKGLGDEKFGILNIAWIVVGYFSFLDFGIGRALTKMIAEKIGSNELEDIPRLFWTSIVLLFFVSLIFTLCLIFLTPILVQNFFNISDYLQTESIDVFYVLAITVPIVTITAGIRGVLEAYQKFKIINSIRIILGVLSFLVPLVCLFFTNSLFWIVVFLFVLRILIWLLHLLQCFKLNDKLGKKIDFDKGLIKPILKFSSWITISNIIIPLIVYSDRFLIGALVSATAITYYATPYEVVTKLLFIPGAITMVLFPTVSASYLNDIHFVKKISTKAVKYIFIIMYPVVLVMITFAHEGLSLWLGQKFSDNSTLILQLLAMGILFNSLAYIPFTLLQGIGKPDIVAKLHLIELPIYLVALWLAIKHFGIDGAALVYFIRMVIDAVILFLIEPKIFFSQLSFHTKYIFGIILIVILVLPLFINGLELKIFLFFLTVTFFFIALWKFLLSNEEKKYIFSRFRIFV